MILLDNFFASNSVGYTLYHKVNDGNYHHLDTYEVTLTVVNRLNTTLVHDP